MNNHDKFTLTFFRVLAKGKYTWEEVEPTSEGDDGSQWRYFYSIRWRLTLNEGDKFYYLACKLTRITRWFDANHEMNWRKSRGDVTQNRKGSACNLHLICINDSFSMNYQNCSFSAFFEPKDNSFARRGVLTYLNSKFFWQPPYFWLYSCLTERRNPTRHPRSGVSARSSMPPCCIIIRRLRESPMPLPPRFVVKNGTKSDWRFSAGMGRPSLPM